MKNNRIRKALFPLLSLLLLTGSCKSNSKAATEEPSVNGKLVVCFASKGDFSQLPRTKEGLEGLAALAHKYGFPVTYYLKPVTAEISKKELKEWYEKYGDEVGWFSEALTIEQAPAELEELKNIVTWQKIRSSGNIKYDADWVKMYLDNGIESVWGRCFEQTYTDDITDRGCPYGFYYANPDCFKSPNPGKGGLITVPWLSNDINLVYRTAQQSTYTFDVNDPQDIGITTPEDDSFWIAELNQYKKQTRYNKVVPLVIQQEIGEFAFTEEGFETWRKNGSAILENLLKILKKENIQVVTVSEAVDMYKEAYPEQTPPTYAIFDNIGQLPIIRNCKSLEMVTSRFSTGKGPSFNGYYATNREDRTWYYYTPDSIPYYEKGRLFSYYDKNGLLMFDENTEIPVRITPYTSLLTDLHGEAMLPEMSCWFDTQKFIPKADIIKNISDKSLSVSISLKASRNIVFTTETLPYGVMLWGDYSAYKLPDNAPEGTKILDKDGLFIPMLIHEGNNALTLNFPKNR